MAIEILLQSLELQIFVAIPKIQRLSSSTTVVYYIIIVILHYLGISTIIDEYF
jgi:hypothetical protein